MIILKGNPPISNPWTNISWGDRIASIDNNCLAKRLKSGRIQTNTLPEPYTGDATSNVYCLNLNPGNACICDTSEPQIKQVFEIYTKQTLCHNINENMWFLLNGTAGNKWWQQKTKWLREWLQKNKNRQNPRMFVIEYFPYHTVKGMKFPTALPSYEYSNRLIRQAMEEGKYIVIMRHWKEWLKRIPKLEHYGKLARLKSPQNPCLTDKNIDTLGNFDLADLLNQF